MMVREAAWRVFADEYNSSIHVEKGTEERTPSYVITPLGAKINRIFAVGVVTDVENIGTESEPMWRARLSDPTGVFYLSAGQYQPEAAQVLSKIKPPQFLAVIGKARTYSPEEGVIYVSIRPETVKVVDSKIRDYWVLDACKSLRKRLDIMDEAMRMEKPDLDSIMALGADRKLAEGVVAAIDSYDFTDISHFNTKLIDSLKYLLPEYGPEGGELEGPHEISEEGTGEGGEKEEDKSEKDDKVMENEDALLDIVDDLDKDVKGANWDDIMAAAKKKGLSRMEIEEATNSLLDKGLIYEPVLGKIKRI